MTFSDPSFTSSMHFEMTAFRAMVFNEMGEIYSGYRQKKKKIPGHRVTDLCVDSMYPLVPNTTSTQDWHSSQTVLY